MQILLYEIKKIYSSTTLKLGRAILSLKNEIVVCIFHGEYVCCTFKYAKLPLKYCKIKHELV